MIVKDRFPLKSLNTFGLSATALHYAGIESLAEIKDFLRNHFDPSLPLLVVGTGSNILFREDFPGWVIRILFKGFEVISEGTETVSLKVYAGEVWDDVVKYCVDHGFGGVENLSLIPGTAGAAPIQNIGAYGVELSQVLESVTLVHIKDGSEQTLSPQECNFGYRESIFKNDLRNKVIIVALTLRLTKTHELKTGYGTITGELSAMGVAEPGIRDVREAVCAIRSRKLPDPTILGNAGSFFKNPAITQKMYQDLLKTWPDVPSYPGGEGFVKIPAAWLIEQCGWKGKRIGDAGVHEHQPLVLVNHGNASGADIIALANLIKASVKERFGIGLTEEVNILP